MGSFRLISSRRFRGQVPTTRKGSRRICDYPTRPARENATLRRMSKVSICSTCATPSLLTCAEYAGLLGRVCPAAVYEYADAEGSEADADGKKFVINSQNCIHVRVYGSGVSEGEGAVR
jgi:hypothetical protein